MTQIWANGESFKDVQYILATQVKQVFYLEDMVRRPPNWKVVKDVNHKKFSNEGVIMEEEDHDVIHFENSSDLTLSTSLNDLDFATLHIDGQSMDVDAPPDIIDVDEDDDIIDDEGALLHDIADFDVEDVVNVDDDDMSTDVARGHDSDGGSDDRLPPHQIRGGYRGNGTRKPNLGGMKASRLNTRKETKNLRLRKITDQFVLQEIWFEWNDRDTLMPLGDHAAHWANLLREIVREFPMHFPSWHNPRRAEGGGLGKDWDPIAFWSDPKNIARCAQNAQNQAKSTAICRLGSRSLAALRDKQMESSATREYPSLIQTYFDIHTIDGVFLWDEKRLLYVKMLRLQGLGTYTNDHFPCKLLAVGSPFFWQWEHLPLAVGTYTASGNSLLAVGMPCAFYSQQTCRCRCYDGADPTRHMPKGTSEGYLSPSYDIDARLNKRHIRMEGTTGWKAWPDERHGRMKGMSGWKARPDRRHIRMEGTPKWKA
nr:hypothetical protein [Tanacetum cinerariifolium]